MVTLTYVEFLKSKWNKIGVKIKAVPSAKSSVPTADWIKGTIVKTTPRVNVKGYWNLDPADDNPHCLTVGDIITILDEDQEELDRVTLTFDEFTKSKWCKRGMKIKSDDILGEVVSIGCSPTADGVRTSSIIICSPAGIRYDLLPSDIITILDDKWKDLNQSQEIMDNNMYPTAKINPILENSVDSKTQKLIDAGIINDTLQLTSGGQRIVAELVAVDYKDALVKVAERILKDKGVNSAEPKTE